MTAAVTNIFPIHHGSTKLYVHGLKVNNVLITEDYVFADVPRGSEIAEDDWSNDLVTLTAGTGHLIGDGTPYGGTYPQVREVFAKVVSDPEKEVHLIGKYHIH